MPPSWWRNKHPTWNPIAPNGSIISPLSSISLPISVQPVFATAKSKATELCLCGLCTFLAGIEFKSDHNTCVNVFVCSHFAFPTKPRVGCSISVDAKSPHLRNMSSLLYNVGNLFALLFSVTLNNPSAVRRVPSITPHHLSPPSHSYSISCSHTGHEQISRIPVYRPVFARRAPTPANDVKRLTRRVRRRLQILPFANANKRRHQVRRRALLVDLKNRRYRTE